MLMDDFLVPCARHGACRIALETDNFCNHGFYEYLGFKRRAIFESTMLKIFTGGFGAPTFTPWI